MIDNFPRKSNGWALLILIVVGLWGLKTSLRGEEPAAEQPKSPVPSAPTAPSAKTDEKPRDPPGLTRLSPNYTVWVDKQNKRVVMVGEICLTSGPLEMFACQKQTKEHESIVAIETKAYVVHAGLLAVGAVPGSPVQFRPEYKPATGTAVDVFVYWTDDKGKRHEAKAQDWILNSQTQKPLEHSWVFGGSGFWTNPNTGERHYMAEEGDLICVSNFTTAMLDLPVESSQADNALMFHANEKQIPPKETRVSIVLVPRLKDLKPDRGGDPKAEEFAPAAKPNSDHQ